MIWTQRPASRVRGFTLMELMVVVGIIAIVAAAVVPSFNRSLQKNRQREAAMLIVEAVFAARSRAARTGRCHRVRVMPSDSQLAGGTLSLNWPCPARYSGMPNVTSALPSYESTTGIQSHGIPPQAIGSLGIH